MNPIAVTAVQAMAAGGAHYEAAILSGALLTMYGSVNDRMRAMDHERLEILTGVPPGRCCQLPRCRPVAGSG